MINTTELVQAIYNIKENVIGIFKHRTTGIFELVVEINKDTIDTVFISNLGGISTCYGQPISDGQLELFPKGTNMNKMLEKPFEFNEFFNKFNKK